MWTFDVATASWDDLERGVTVTRWSRVVVSRAAYPDWRVAADVAGALAAAVHRGTATAVLPRH